MISAEPAGERTGKAATLSVAVCTYNPRPDYLQRCVTAILDQSIGRDAFEFFIVDNGSGEPVAQLEWLRRLNVRVIREERRGLTAAKERVARTAEGNAVVFVDDDNVLDREYLRTVIDILHDARIGVFSGSVAPEYEQPPAPWFEFFEETIAIRRFPGDHHHLTSVPEYSRYFPIGAGCCVRRSLLREYFVDAAATGRVEGRSGAVLSAGEDLDLALFALSRGFLIGSSGRLRLVHLIPRRRTEVGYVVRLTVGSLRSMDEIERKWKTRLGVNIFPYFNMRPGVVLLKALLYTCLYPAKRFRVLAHFHLTLFRILSSRSRAG